MCQKIKHVFFCSAYNDISFILFEVEKSNFSNNLVFVVNNSGVNEFFLSLKVPGLQVYFIETRLKNPFNPIDWVKEFYFLNFNFGVKLKQLRNMTIFLSATFYDYLSMFAASRLNKYNNLCYGLMPESGEFMLANKRISDLLLSFLYSAPIRTYISSGLKVRGLNNKFTEKFIAPGRNYQKMDFIKIQKKYAIKVSTYEPYILLLSSKEDEGLHNVYGNTKEIFYNIISNCNNQEIFVKTHPRLGSSSFMSNAHFRKFPENIPLEFINLDNCKLVIGINSIALANIADLGIKTISLLYLMDFFSEEFRTSYIKYLNVNNFNKSIIYPKSIIELNSIIINK